jgi:hypothetical protein
MISIATERLSSAKIADALLEQSLSLFLSVLKGIIEQAGDEHGFITALDSVGRLSRVYGKAELDLFEPLISSIIQHGVLHPNLAIKSAALKCLSSMLYCLSLLHAD